MMKNAILTSLAAAGLLAAGSAGADVTGNIGLATDYMFRGISQTNDHPAVQGGLDYTHSSGAYAGVWASNLNFEDNNEASIEIDTYAGMTGKVDDLSWKFGGVRYNYPGVSDRSNLHYDYWEFGPTLSYPLGPVTTSLTVQWSPNFFNETGKALYSELGLSIPIEQFTLGGTAGHQDIKRNAKFGTPDYNNWSVYVSTTWVGLSFKLAYTDTDLSKNECFGGVQPYADWCSARAVFSVGKTL
jgi:uncharacterized protein (TIGR02001 family)